jgi:predicted aspartyl protease
MCKIILICIFKFIDNLYFLKKTFFLFTIFLFTFSINLKAQEGFSFLNKSNNHQRISFKLINNLIVIPVQINKRKLHFILDTGVNKTILFNISQNDSIGLNNVQKVKLQGLGKGEPVDALISKNNKLSINKVASKTETIYVILKDYFDLSGKMGTTIHGIIGYNLLKNFIIEINYKTKKIDFYNPNTYRSKKCRKCESFPLKFYRNKPYISAKVQLDTIGSKLIDVNMLIDSGGSDAVWLFEDSKEEIKTPKRFFNDILGEGLSGAIYGNRSRVPKIKIGSFEIESPTVSFLDTISTKNARSFKERNGSIGAGILKRFKVRIDYPNKKITFKKNGSFTSGFNYNMSGLDVVYDGKQLVKEEVIKSYTHSNESSGASSINFITSFSFKFKPSFRINSVLKNSPAEKAGLLKGDLILKINGKPSHEFNLNDVIYKFKERHNKRIKMYVKRNEEILKFQFRLEKKV